MESLQEIIVKSVDSHITDYISHPPKEIRYAVDKKIQWVDGASDSKPITEYTVNQTEMTSITKDQSIRKTLARQAEQNNRQAEE